MTRVVAVTVNYRRADDTVRCVRSLASLVPPVDVVVIDNGSADGSAAAIRAAAPAVDVVELERNIGYTGGANAGIRCALTRGSDFVLVLNNDVEVTNPSFVAQLIERLEAHPRAAFAGPRVRLPDGTIQPTVEPFPTPAYALRLALRTRLRCSGARTRPESKVGGEVDVVNGVCLLLRADALRELGGFDERYFMYGEESDLAARARGLGWSCLHVPVEAIVHHHPAGEERPGARLLGRRNFVRFCRDHNGRGSALAAAFIFVVAAAARDLRRRQLFELPPLARAVARVLLE